MSRSVSWGMCGKMRLLAAAAAAFVVSSAADATAFTWSFTNSRTHLLVASGTLTTSDTANSTGAYSVLSFTGTTSDQTTITGITDPYAPATAYFSSSGAITAQPTSGTVGSFDNNLFVSSSPTQKLVDDDGILFQTAAFFAVIYYENSTYDFATVDKPGSGISGGTTIPGTFKVTQVATPPAAVPEPATWALFIGGFGLIGSALRRKGTALRFG